MEYEPGKDYGDQGPSMKHNDNLPPGDYLLVGKFFVAKTSQDGNDYCRVVMEVIAGPLKGASFWQFVGINWNKPEVTMKRIAWQCQASRVDYSFDPQNLEQLAGALLHRPFKAEVVRKKYRDDPQNDIARFILPTKGQVGKSEIDLMNKWMLENEDLELNYRDKREVSEYNYDSSPEEPEQKKEPVQQGLQSEDDVIPF